jgi:hypothetical protein
MKDTTPTFLNTLDDMRWLYQTHLKKFPQLWYTFKSAYIFGNEDCPCKIELYTKLEPLYTTKPKKVFVINDEGNYVES